VPALLTVLGRHSWTIPRWLDRALPNITIEPPATREPAAGPVPREPAETTAG
jgi:RND superfamily putative drug exporter